jgi:hypothetical protein
MCRALLEGLTNRVTETEFEVHCLRGHCIQKRRQANDDVKNIIFILALGMSGV